MCFLDRLPNADSNLFDEVKTELLHLLILRLMRDSKYKDLKIAAMLGSPEFCQKIWSWQALCVTSRFVSIEISSFPLSISRREPQYEETSNKAEIFFDRFDADTACTPEYIFTIPVDEGCDANPENMVDVIKQCLAEVYEDARGYDVPNWKRVQVMIESEETGDGHDKAESSHEVNFQRNFKERLFHSRLRILLSRKPGKGV
jgi:hypothetical protein